MEVQEEVKVAPHNPNEISGKTLLYYNPHGITEQQKQALKVMGISKIVNLTEAYPKTADKIARFRENQGYDAIPIAKNVSKAIVKEKADYVWLNMDFAIKVIIYQLICRMTADYIKDEVSNTWVINKLDEIESVKGVYDFQRRFTGIGNVIRFITAITHNSEFKRFTITNV